MMLCSSVGTAGTAGTAARLAVELSCDTLAPHVKYSKQHFEQPKPGGKFVALPQPAATLLGSGWLPGADTARPTLWMLPVLMEASLGPAFLGTVCV